MTSTATATHTAVNTPTHTKTHTFTQTSTTTPTSTATLTATNASTVNFTPTTTYTPVFTTTFTATVSSNLTSTSTPTRSITPTMTSIPSLSPTGVPNCLNESVNIFDASGELVRQLCGTGIFPSQNLLLTFGAYQPVPGGKGGSLPILLNGVVVAVWDSTDQQGKLVTNGFYQIEIVQVPAPPNSTVVTGDVYIDPNHTLSPIQLSASPNLSRDGTVVVFRSQIQGLPAGPGNEPLRIFTLTGDLVKTLDWQNGQTAWNLTNMPGETVASGLYLASEEASDALSGVKIHKTVKVVILR